MRARVIVIGVFAVGCSMDNPAFETGAASGSEVGTATDSSGSADGDEDNMSMGSAEAGTADGTAEGQEAPEPLCPLAPGEPLQIELGPPGCSGMPETLTIFREFESVSGSTIYAYGCESDSGCDMCSNAQEDVPIPMNFGPLHLDGLADVVAPLQCLKIVAHRVNPANPDVCTYQTVLIEPFIGASGSLPPLLLASNTPDVMLPERSMASGLAQFEPMLVDDEECPCDEYPAECCNGIPTKTLAYNIGMNNPVQIGADAVPVPISNEVAYEFFALDGYQPGVCDEPTRGAWALVRKALP